MPKRKFDIRPYTDILVFVVALFAANWVWKLSISGDEGHACVTCLGWDVTPPFDWLTQHIATVVYAIVHWFRDTAVLRGTQIVFDTGSRITVVWSCTAIKQSFIWLVILLAARGAWYHKCWFIPLGWLCIYVFNIFRIAVIALAIADHPEWFELLHTYLFKYLFYSMLFLLWLIWTNKIAAPPSPDTTPTADPH